MPGGTTVYAYNMGLYYDNGLAPRFIPSLAAAKLRNWHGHGVQGIYWCGGNENWGGEGPTYYTIGRLATDLTLDPAKVYEEYLTLTFHKAAPAMKQYYDLLYEQLETHRSLDGRLGHGRRRGRRGRDLRQPLLGRYAAEAPGLPGCREAAGGRRPAGPRLGPPGRNVLQPLLAHHQGIPLPSRVPAQPDGGEPEAGRDAVGPIRPGRRRRSGSAQTDKAFADNFLPNAGIWANEQLKTNYGHLRCRAVHVGFREDGSPRPRRRECGPVPPLVALLSFGPP